MEIKRFSSFHRVSWVVAKFLLAALIGPISHQTVAQGLPPSCGTLSQSWGPFDYRPERYIWEPTYRSHKALLAIVENAHFTHEVENLFRGKTGALPGGDLSYTLGVFPNHHRALIAISNLGLKLKVPQAPESRYSIECYFYRAMAFRPDDHVVRMIHANYLAQLGNTTAAEAEIDAVAATDPENPFTLRNIALLYFDIKNYDKSLKFAHQAAATGLNIDSVKSKLQQVGQWTEPTLAPQAPPAASKPSDETVPQKD